MQQAIIPAHAPGQSESNRPPMIYVEKQLKWEYKLIVRNLERERLPDEEELNALGKDGWEMTGIAQQGNTANFYLKRLIEK